MTAHEPYLLSSEDPAEFAELHRGLEESHLPGNAHERILVEEFAHACWELKRIRRVDREFWQNISSHYHPGEAGIAEAIAQEKETRFRIHLRLRAQAEHSYYRALAALDRMHRDRDRIAREKTSTAPAPRPNPSPSAGSRPHLRVVPPQAPIAAERLDDTGKPFLPNEPNKGLNQLGSATWPGSTRAAPLNPDPCDDINSQAERCCLTACPRCAASTKGKKE